jgi:hypothetical protein
MKDLDDSRMMAMPMSPLFTSFFKIIFLSATSAVTSQLLGFNLRLWKVGGAM